MDPNPKQLQIISWNVNGLRNRMTDVHYYAHKANIDVILLQETGDRNGSLLSINGYKAYHLPACPGVRGLITYVKNSIPSELIEEPHKTDGIESLSVRVYLQKGLLNIVNLYVSKNSFYVDSLPDSVFNETTVIAGDLNARHNELEDEGRMNTNGARFFQFLADYPDALLFRSKKVTHIQGGRLDYAVIINGQGLSGDCEVVTDLPSDHYSLLISIPLGKVDINYSRKRLRLPKDKTDYFITGIKNWYKDYVPYDVNQFYEDMIKVIEELLIYKKHKIKRGNPSQSNKYYNDKMLRECSRTIKRAHRK